MTHPGGTGYSRGLYSIPDAPAHLRDVFENKFLSIADGQAAASLRRMVQNHEVPSGADKIAWTRFVMTLLYRTPEGVRRAFEMVRKFYDESLSELITVYDTIKKATDPPTAEEYLKLNSPRMTTRTMIEHLLDIMQSEKVGTRIMDMQWHMGRMHNSPYPFLTSDRPIIMTNGIAHPTSHIVIPLSPVHIFIATNTDDEANRIKALSKSGEIVRRLNDQIARQARKFVYGSDDRQLRFVENRLGDMVPCSPFE